MTTDQHVPLSHAPGPRSASRSSSPSLVGVGPTGYLVISEVNPIGVIRGLRCTLRTESSEEAIAYSSTYTVGGVETETADRVRADQIRSLFLWFCRSAGLLHRRRVYDVSSPDPLEHVRYDPDGSRHPLTQQETERVL